MASTLIRLCARTAAPLCRNTFVRNYAEAVAQPGQMVFSFGSPEQAFYDSSTSVKQIDVPTGSGMIGILASHVPTFGVLKPGVLTVFENEGAANKFFVSSGTYTIIEDSTVQIAAEEVVTLDQIDKDLARSNLSQAQSQLSSASSEEAKAEAQVAVDCYEEILAASA